MTKARRILNNLPRLPCLQVAQQKQFYSNQTKTSQIFNQVFCRVKLSRVPSIGQIQILCL